MDIYADEEDEEMKMDLRLTRRRRRAPSSLLYPVVLLYQLLPPAARGTEPMGLIPPCLPTACYIFPTSITTSAHGLHHHTQIPVPTITTPHLLGIAIGPGYEVGESSATAAARPAGGLMADYGFVATMDRDIRRDPERYVGYGITDSWDEIVETLQGAPVSTDTELGAHVREFESMTEARMSREAWGRSMDASDLARAEVMSLRTIVHAQMSEITEFTVETDHTTERDDSTSGTGHHTAGAGDSLTGIGDGITGAGYYITGTAGTRWGSCTARAPKSW
ncbi:hypothetical protein Tco_1226466 [Tanacetum coccineum]